MKTDVARNHLQVGRKSGSITPPPRLSSPTTVSNISSDHYGKSPRKLSFSAMENGDSVRRGSFDKAPASPKHSAATTTMLSMQYSPKNLPNGDDERFQIPPTVG